MPVRPVLTWPDPRLNTVAAPVTRFDAELARLVIDLFETMAAEEGVGLAATQIDVHLRVLVMDCGGDTPRPRALINPEITAREGTLYWCEGCLSVPGVRAEVERAEAIEVRYQDLDGSHHQLRLTDLEAVCVQHEVDHLDGRLYIDRLGALERQAVLADYAEAPPSASAG